MSIRWCAVRSRLDRVLDEMRRRRHLAFSPLLEKIWSPARSQCQQIKYTEPVDHRPVMQLFQAYLGAATTGRVVHSMSERGIFKRNRRLELSMITMTASCRRAGRGRRGLVGVSRTSRRRPRSFRPTAASAPPMSRWLPGIPLPHQLEL